MVKMMRKLFSITIATLSLILMAGCEAVLSNVPSGSIPSTQESSETASHSQALPNEQDSSEAPRSITLVTNSGTGKTGGISTDDGYYYIEKTPQGNGGNICYIDHETGANIYLSSQINNTHSDETDESYFDSIIGGVSVFFIDDDLYVFRRGSPEDSGNFGDAALPELIKMSPSGRNRSIVYQGSASQRYQEAVAGDTNAIYSVCVNIDPNSAKEFYELVEISLDTGVEQVLYETANPLFLLGGYKDSLICKEIIRDENLEGLEKYQAQIHQLFELSVKDFKRQTLKEWKQVDNITQVIADGQLICLNSKERMIEKFNFETGKETQVDASGFIRDDTPNVWNLGVWGRWWVIYTENMDGYKGEAVQAYNIDTDEVHRVSLCYENHEKGVAQVLPICAAIDDDFLVIIGERPYPVTYIDQDGDEFKMTLTQDQYAFISIQDYLANRENYREIAQTPSS